MKISAENSGVYLATLEIEDAQAISKNINDPDVITGINNPAIHYPYTIDDAIQFIRFSELRYGGGEEIHMGIHLSGNGLIGLCAVFGIDKNNRKAEIGYWLGKRHWGKGYAKGALRLLLGFCFGELNLNRVYAKVLVRNERSKGLLGSLGFSNEGIEKDAIFRDGEFLDEVRFSLLKKDYAGDAKIDVVDYK
jgi:RimJ/RimL family protein N-acetyltransferase